MMFGANTPEGPWNTALHRDPDPLTDMAGDLLSNFGTPRISKTAKARDLKWGQGRVTLPTFKYWDPLVSPERLKLET